MSALLKKLVSRVRGGAVPSYREIWNHFGSLKEAREHIYNEGDAEAFDRGGRIDAELVARFLPPGAAVMDLGCGIGRVEQFLAPQCRTLVGIDIAERMVDEARRLLARHGNLSFRQNNGRDLSVCEDAEFDFVFSFFVLQHVEKEDAFRYVREICRVLKPGGRALIQFPLTASRYFDESFLSDVDRGPPYHLTRPRLYTPSESIFALTMAGLYTQQQILRGDESILLCATEPPDLAGFRSLSRMVDPATSMGLWGTCLSQPPPGGALRMDLADLALTEGAGMDEDGTLLLEAGGERVIAFGEETWRDYRIDLELTLEGACDLPAAPDFAIGVRRAQRDTGLAGPFVQTALGHAWGPRVCDGDWWDDLPFASARSADLAVGPMRLVVVVAGRWLSLYDADGWVFTALTEAESGPAYLRLVQSRARIHAFQVSTLSECGMDVPPKPAHSVPRAD